MVSKVLMTSKFDCSVQKIRHAILESGLGGSTESIKNECGEFEDAYKSAEFKSFV